MKKNVTLNEAFELIIEAVTPTNIKKPTFIYDSLGEFIAEDIIAKRNAPVFTNSAMDGFAFKNSDIRKLKIIKTIYAGDKYEDFEIKEDECVRIMTGAKVPTGLDTVIPMENCLEISDTHITIPKIKTGANIRKKGEEIQKGEVLLKKGTLITAEKAALLFSQGIVNIKTYKKPTIAILSTGNELKEPWEDADEEEIYNVNSHAIKMLLKTYGFEADIIGMVEDSLEKTAEFISNLKHYDVIITSGGISFGDKDYLFDAFKLNSLSPVFHKINLKPGRPTMFGIMGKTYVFAMPGNPLSAYLNTFYLAIPALRKLSGALNYTFNPVKAKLAENFKANPKKAHLVLGEYKNGIFKPIQNYKYGSSMLSALAQANALFALKENTALNEDIEIYYLNSDFVFNN